MPDATMITEVTLGEVYRKVGDLIEAVGGVTESLNGKPSWDDIRRMEEARLERSQLHAAKELKQDEAIKALEEQARQLMRIVIAAILTGLVSLAVGIGVAVVVAGLKAL